MARYRRQTLFTAVCFVTVLVAKMYVGRFVRHAEAAAPAADAVAVTGLVASPAAKAP